MLEAKRSIAREGSVGAMVEELTTLLARAGIEQARREARDLIAAVQDAPRFWATLHAHEELHAEDRARCLAAAHRRAAGAPFAYAVGRASFRHLTLRVDERVLIPRQETEQLVAEVLARESSGIAVDIGTGSGAIALALASEGKFERVIGTDVSVGALDIACANAAALAPGHVALVEWRAGVLLVPVRGVRARVVVSNPPYIAYDEAPALPRSVRDWEPPLALFSAGGGMGVSSSIIREAPDVLEPGGLLALELDSRRASLAAELALADGRYRDVSVRLDLAGRERFLIARRKDG